MAVQGRCAEGLYGQQGEEGISGDSKDYVRSLLKEGYAYRLCIADDEPAEQKTEIKALLDAEIKKVTPEAAGVRHSLRLRNRRMGEHVPCYCSGVAGFFHEGLFHFATWQNRECAVTKTFVATPESGVIFENVQSHLDWKGKPTTARLTVSGDAGVGKSRTVFEATAALPEVARWSSTRTMKTRRSILRERWQTIKICTP